MSAQKIETHTFENGLTLLVEQMPGVKSGAFSLMVPGGSVFDPPDANGSAALLCEMLLRGAGDLGSREFNAALDNLGVQHREHAGNQFVTFSGATLAEHIPAALQLYGELVLRPHLPEDQFEAARQVVAQTLKSIEDEPRQKIMVDLRKRCYDAPWGWPNDGTLEGLAQLTSASPREHRERCFLPNGSILAVAGNVEFEAIRELAGQIFGDWSAGPLPTFETTPGGPSRDHIPHESEQTHIGIAYPTVPYSHPDYYAAWAAVGILSGGMSARLFTEVREKRGLCYSVYASHNSLKDDARVLCYAGTTAARAQETLDVTLAELIRLEEGLEENELACCKARAKSALVMQQESTMRRASSMAGEWYHMGRVRTLEEIQQKIDGLTTDEVLRFIREYPARDFTILTLGPAPLEVNLGVS